MDEAVTHLTEFLSPYPPAVHDDMLAARSILKEMIGPASELVYDATSAVCDGFAYTADVNGLFVNLAAYSDHVTLVFAYGAVLNDPENRLKGGGKQVRHIRLAGPEDLRDPYLTGLIQQADANAPPAKVEGPPRLVVKSYDGPKRRPKQS